MSIYCSDFGIEEDHTEDCRRWVKASRKVAESHEIDMWTDDGHYWYDKTRLCTCGVLGPWLYQGSHVLPMPDHPRGGAIDIASIPHFITPDGGYDENGSLNDWLRVSIFAPGGTYGQPEDGDATLVINREQAESLRNYLNSWLEREE